MNQFITRAPIPGEVIVAYHGDDEDAPDGEFFRVLYVNKNFDRIVFARATPKRSAGRLYFCSPRVEKLSWLLSEEVSRQFMFLSGGLPLRQDVRATPEELDKKYRRGRQKQSVPRAQRAERYELIRPMIECSDPEDQFLLLDPQVRHEKIGERAKELRTSPENEKRLRRRITDILNQYFAEGSTPGSVTPYTGGCGGRGKEKKLTDKKSGPQNIPTKAGKIGVEGRILSEQEKELCGFGWRNYYIRGKTLAKAFRKFKREFYFDVIVQPDGRTTRVVRPDHECPTDTQFAYWGQIRSPGHDIWKKQFSASALARIDRVLFGSSNENVVKIGQRGAIDSTTTDQEFVSVINRLNRIGQAHRVLIVNGKHKYIPGFYMGLDAPGSLPVQLACLHALTDKTEWLKWLGLEDQDPKNWIPIRFVTLLADNTDARAQAAMKVLEKIQTGIKFVPVRRSDLNSDVETTHHSLHRLVDHNLVGTTHGQRTERGEEKAEVVARMTIVEGIRESARAIYAYNTMELDIEPTLEMQRELVDKGIKLTRANLTRWEIERGNQATCLISDQEARTALLIPTRGTFTKEGVRLLREDTGGKREFIDRVRYICHNKIILEKCLASKVKRSRAQPTNFDSEFLHDPYRPSEIYYRDLYSGELISLAARTDDSQMLDECALADIQELGEADKFRQYLAESARSRQISDLEAAQEQANQLAEDEYQLDAEKADKLPSKSAIRRGKKANREAEKSVMNYGMPIVSPIGRTEAAPADGGQSVNISPELPLQDIAGAETPGTSESELQAVVQTSLPPPRAQKKSVFARIVELRQTEMTNA